MGNYTQRLRHASIVIPIYNEEEGLPALRRRMHHVISDLDCRVEVILVNDGSSDRSLYLMKEWARESTFVKIVDLSRNFGHQLAITAGIDVSVGDFVIVMDGDLQDPPELIPNLIEKHLQGFDVVYAKRSSRIDESLSKRFTAALFYRLMSRYIHPGLPHNVGDFRLMSRQVVDALCQMKEQHRFVRGMVCWIGFKQAAVEFDRPFRKAGKTKFSMSKMTGFALDAIFSFSSKPLRFGTAVGILVLMFGAFYTIYTLFNYLFLSKALTPGWTTLIILICLIGGSTLFCIGLLGEYVGRIFEETKGRPLYIVRETVNFPQVADTKLESTNPKEFGIHKKLGSYVYTPVGTVDEPKTEIDS